MSNFKEQLYDQLCEVIEKHYKSTPIANELGGDMVKNVVAEHRRSAELMIDCVDYINQELGLNLSVKISAELTTSINSSDE
jgi:hypothetical protein